MQQTAAAGGSTSELPPGTLVGHYEILGELGRGGMGVVYRARDATLGRDVALKTPLLEYASDEYRRYFLIEARAASRLSHPSIVPIFEAFEDQGRPWLAMALAEGRPLRALINERGGLPIEEAVQHGETLAEALEVAHAKHVLHRDVTPNNIFVTPEGHAVLMDFGLARFFVPRGEESRASTHPGSGASSGDVVGTLGYMSPEQLLGRPLNASTDIFSLGAVLYEMCTGVRAFPGGTGGEVTDATLHRDPPPITRFTHGVPPELERIVRKAIARRPDERFATAQDLLVDLRKLRRQFDSGHVDSPVPTEQKGRRWLWWGAATAAVAAAVALWALWRPQGLPVGEPRQLTSGSGWEADPAISPDGTLVAYASEEADNVDVWIVDARGGEPLRLTTDSAIDRDPAWFPDGSTLAFMSERSGRHGVWKVPRLGGSQTLVVDDARDPAISPDGTRIAFTRLGPRGDLRVFVAPLADPAAARMITADGYGVWDHVQPAWSPDGTRICYAAQRDLWVVPSTGGGAQRLTTDGEYHRDPAWSPGGGYIYFWSYRESTSALWRIESGGGQPLRASFGSGPERHPTVSRDGSRLAYTTFLENPDVIVRDLVSGTERKIGGQRDESEPALSPDGRTVAFVSDRWAGDARQGDLWLQPLSANGEPAGPARRLTDHPGTVSHLSYSPDGRWIAYHRVLEGQRDIWIVPASGGPPQPFTDDPALDVHPNWSPDGRAIAFVSDRSGTQNIWAAPVADGRPAGPGRQITKDTVSREAPAWSPDSTRIAYVELDEKGNREVWIVPAGGGAPTHVTRGALAHRVRWDSQTRSLFVSGYWKDDRISLRRIPLVAETHGEPEPLVWFDADPERVDFDVSRDGRLLVFSRADPRGDVWVVDARRGRY